MPFIMLRQSTGEHALPTTMEAGVPGAHNRARPERVGSDEHFDFVRSCLANTGTELAACGLILNAGPSMQAYAASSSVMSHRSGAAHPSISHSNGAQSLLLTDSVNSIGGPPPLLAGLSQSEREHVLAHGRKRVFYRGQTLFNQGAKHDGIYLIETGRIRVFYMAPSQREITLAYWLPGNFVGGPEIFGEGIHQWSGVASSNSGVVHFSGKDMRKLVLDVPTLAIGLIEGLTFKGKCYSALAQMLGTRSVTERLAHLLLNLIELYGVKEADGIGISAAFTHADLAHMVGATRQWVTISLKRLQEKGVVISRKSRIIVRRPDVLQEMRGPAE
jgi:CRP/FNR family transcriptional regulator, cyclic AMP receptor protein